jgi:hypothetical protein
MAAPEHAPATSEGWESDTLKNTADAEDPAVPGANLAPSQPGQAVDETEKDPQPTKDVIPEGGYGWVCVACCTIINAHSWGINSVSDKSRHILQETDLASQSYAVFLAHYLDTNAFEGATPLQFAFVGGVSVGLALLIAPLATLLVRRYGTQVCCMVGTIFEVAALIGASFSTKILHLFLSQGICYGL